MYAEKAVYRFILRGFLKSAKLIICPDLFRSSILKVWYKLDYFPYVLLNKPIIFNDQLDIDYNNASQAAFDQIEKICNGRKIAIYQGHIDSNHRDISLFVKAFEVLRDKWLLILMGKDHSGLAAELS